MEKLLACFTTAREAPVKLESLEAVHLAMFDEAPVGDISIAIVQAAITFCLSAEARLVIAIGFTSRDDVENMIGRMRVAFDEARELAADANDSSNYQALTALAGSVIAHLSDIARPLARMVTFRMKKNIPALTAAQRLYYDPTRWEEIVAENKTFHPAFVQREIRGLSK
jgi:prophage DNA circulation protein